MRNSGWTYDDARDAERQGWHLHHTPVGESYMPYVYSRRHGSTYSNRQIEDTEERDAFRRVLESALCGDSTGRKALYLIVQTNRKFAEYGETVKALGADTVSVKP